MLKKMRRIGISIDMTPMVDIAFLLLIFFMATTVFKPPEKDQINLPESNSEAKAPESDVITIAVTKTPTVRVLWRQGGQEHDAEVPAAQVLAELGGILNTARRANPAARMIVKMDKDAPYGVMSDMMEALQEARAPRFNVQTNLETTSGGFQKAVAGGSSH